MEDVMRGVLVKRREKISDLASEAQLNQREKSWLVAADFGRRWWDCESSVKRENCQQVRESRESPLAEPSQLVPLLQLCLRAKC